MASLARPSSVIPFETHLMCSSSIELVFRRVMSSWRYPFVFRFQQMFRSALPSGSRLSRNVLCLKQSDSRHNACRDFKANLAGGKRETLGRVALNIRISPLLLSPLGVQLTMFALCTGQPWLGNVFKGEIKVWTSSSSFFLKTFSLLIPFYIVQRAAQICVMIT